MCGQEFCPECIKGIGVSAKAKDYEFGTSVFYCDGCFKEVDDILLKHKGIDLFGKASELLKEHFIKFIKEVSSI